MGLIELTYWRISRIDIFTAVIENFLKIWVEGFFVQEIRVWLLPFFTKNCKLATNETLNIAFVVRAVNQKIWDQNTKVPVTNVKVHVATIFQNAREFSNLPVKILEKSALPVTTFDKMPVKSQKVPVTKFKKSCLTGIWGVTEKKHWTLIAL